MQSAHLAPTWFLHRDPPPDLVLLPLASTDKDAPEPPQEGVGEEPSGREMEWMCKWKNSHSAEGLKLLVYK